MESDVTRCMLCNGTAVKISEHEYRCVECNYLNHRGK